MSLLTRDLTDRTGMKQVAIDQPGEGPLLLSYNSTASEEPNGALRPIQSSRATTW